jgi:hypothetical protein
MDPEIAQAPDQVMMKEDGTPDLESQDIVRTEILKRIEDSLRVERDWRTRGQKVQSIYRGDLSASGSSVNTGSRFNVLNSNVGILLPSLFSNPPKAELKSRAAIPSPIDDAVTEALQKTLEVFLDDSSQTEAFRSAVKEVLLPGRATVRVRWDPLVETKPQTDEMGAPVMDEQMNPVMVSEKLLDQMYLEHVYWEDYTHEATASWASCGWVAYRHLFTEKSFLAHFGNVAAVKKLIQEGNLESIFKWTDASAKNLKGTTNGNSQSGSRTGTRSNRTGGLQDVIKKALVWEFWDKSTRETIWLCQDMEGSVVRIDPDILKLKNFFPSPMPMLAVTTTDNMIPTPEYIIYQDLAAEIDELSDRIAAIARRIKIRGAYDATQEGLANILKEDDGVMVAVNGYDISGDLSKHLYIVPINDLVSALQALYQARDQAKQTMYEVTGISDIVRGQTRASETLGAQRIKSQFATLRIEDRKRMVEHFSRDVISIMAEIICEHFSAESIFYFSGVRVPPEAFAMLRSDGMRISKIDVETDSTISVDETADQQSMAAMLQSLGLVLQQMMPMVSSGQMPLPIAIEMLKMATKPFKYSRNLSMLLDKYMMMLMGPGGGQPGAQMPGGMQPPAAGGPQLVPQPGAAA